MLHSKPDPLGPLRHVPMAATAALMVVSGVVGVALEGWGEATIPALVLLTTLPPLVVEKWARIRIPAGLQLQYALLLLAGPYLGGHWDMYQVWDPWDKWVHLYSGFPISLGVIFAIGITCQRYNLRLPPWVEAVVVISVKALVALLWEIAEFIYDELFDANAQDHNFDTMTDMILGTLPGFLIAAALILHRTKGYFGYLGRLLHTPQR